jgi:FtsH-binding integral membrane protein
MRQEQAYARPQGRGRFGYAVAETSVERRARFIVRTYNHLFLAILAFTAIEVALYYSGLMLPLAIAVSRAWLLALGAFVLVGNLASGMAARSRSLSTQYLALGLFVSVEAMIFAPLLFIAATQYSGVIESAATVTLVGFGALTAIAFVSRKDFSFLRGILFWGAAMAFVLIVASLIFGFQLGVFFMVGVVALSGGFILYHTSNVLHHYPEDRYVSAALALFSSVATTFYYVIMLFMGSRR